MPSDSDPEKWLQPPLAPESKGPSKHGPSPAHYTNFAGLSGIIASSSLWACSTDGLNDSQEVEFGVAAFRRLWERVKPGLIDGAPIAEFDAWLTDIEIRARRRQVLIVSACADGDSLLHWQNYASIVDGYAIEFSPTAEFKILGGSGTSALFQPDDVPAIFWREVIYGDKDPDWGWDYWDPTRRLLENALDNFAALRSGRVLNEPLMRDLLDRQYLTMVYAYKHGGFASENEWRLIVVGPPFKGFTVERDTRFGAGLRASLAAVPESDWDYYSVAEISPLPIQSIRLAPRNPIGDEERIRSLLEGAGYQDVPLSRSSTPIR